MTTARILIVDDEVDACQNLADILSDAGYEVDAAYDGESALELVGRNAYDVALLDLKMPGMDGVELYRRIKQLSEGTTAIVVTAFAGSEKAQDAVNAGITQILAKPVDISQLMKSLKSSLEQPLVMIVDDDPELCKSLCDVFHEHRYRTIVAHDLPDAEVKLLRHQYQVVLIDMRLPTGSGAEVFDLVRRRHAAIRTIMITGYRSETERQIAEVLAAGADEVAYKPFDVRRLLSTLGRLSRRPAFDG